MRYVPALDGIRAVAVLLVLAFHARVPGVQGGFLGVDLFFVLSGYLITTLLAEEHEQKGSIAVGKFYIRRLRRLYPALLLLICAYLLCAETFFREKANHLRDAVMAGLYLADYGRAIMRAPEVLQHTWSLSVEEHFYLIWPLLLLATFKLQPRQRMIALLAMFALATAWRWIVLGWTEDWRQSYYRFDTRLSGLMLGAATSLWRPTAKTWFAVAGGLLVAVSVHLAQWRQPASLTWIALMAEVGAALVVLGAERVQLLSARPLAWMGRMSYGIYLWHYPIVHWMRDAFFGWQETLIVGAVLSTAIAAFSHYLVERPLHRSLVANS